MPKRTLKGQVVSDKPDKTIIVAITRKKRHKLYHKIITFTRKFMAHDELNEAKAGDTVLIEECRPHSRLKRWMLKEIVEKAI